MDSIQGHQEARRLLFQSIKKNTLHPVLLFYGPFSIGKKLVALEMVQALLCPFFCKNCRDCRQVANKQHPSLLFIEPEGISIKVEVLSQVRSFISLQSFSSYRVVLVDQADKMNLQTQNALLKSLEEPPSGVQFILVCDQISRLLPTIRSRAQLIHFNRLNFQEMKKILPEEPEWKLKASRGQVSRISHWEEEEDLYKEIFNLMEGQKISNHLGMRLKERKTALLVARTFQEILRDICIMQKGGEDLIHIHQRSFYNKWMKVCPSDIYQLYEKACQLEQDILSYLDSLLCFENYWNQVCQHISGEGHLVD